MEIGSITKAQPVSPPWLDAARLSKPAVEGTKTELPASAAVLQTAERPAVDTEIRRPGTPAGDTVEPRVVIDADARQVVFQSVDSFTGEVVVQTPDKALLRQRAYVIQVEDAKLTETQAGFVERRV